MGNAEYMGTQCNTGTMWTNLLISISILSTAKADTCSDCTAVVNHIEEFLITRPGLDLQTTILVAGLCPLANDPEACPEALPPFWKMIADLLWPSYYDPNCVNGIKASIDQLVAESTLDAIVDTLANGEFCANVGEGCPEVVDFVIRQGLPLLASADVGGDATFQEACNGSVPGTCPA